MQQQAPPVTWSRATSQDGTGGRRLPVCSDPGRGRGHRSRGTAAAGCGPSGARPAPPVSAPPLPPARSKVSAAVIVRRPAHRSSAGRRRTRLPVADRGRGARRLPRLRAGDRDDFRRRRWHLAALADGPLRRTAGSRRAVYRCGASTRAGSTSHRALRRGSTPPVTAWSVAPALPTVASISRLCTGWWRRARRHAYDFQAAAASRPSAGTSSCKCRDARRFRPLRLTTTRRASMPRPEEQHPCAALLADEVRAVDFGIDDLAARRRTHWDGVRNSSKVQHAARRDASRRPGCSLSLELRRARGVPRMRRPRCHPILHLTLPTRTSIRRAIRAPDLSIARRCRELVRSFARPVTFRGVARARRRRTA